MRRILTIAGCLLIVAAGWLFLQPAPIIVDLAAVTRGDMLQTVRDDGRTRIRERYTVSAPLAGRLVRVDLDPGDAVVAEQTLVAVIQPTDPALLDPRAVAEARARVQTAQARIAQLVPRLSLAREKLNLAEAEYGRIRKIFDQEASSRAGLDDAQLAFDIARAEYSDVTYLQQIAEFELKLAQAALIHTHDQTDGTSTSDDGPAVTESNTAPEANQAKKEFQLQIRSPVSGRILRVFQESATVIAAGEPLLEVGDPADLEVEVDVLSSDAVQIQPGATVFLEQWGGERVLPAKVRLVEPSAFTKVSALGIEEQRVNVIIDFVDDAPPPPLGDGFRVDARIVIWEGHGVLKVPVGALFRVADEWAVFRNINNRAVTTPVTLGHRNDVEAEVIAGLQESDNVVVHPGDKLKDGSLLQPR